MKRAGERGGPPPEAWQAAFSFGFDYFAQLMPWGIRDPHLSGWAPGSEARWEAAVAAAWRVHGRSFLASWKPSGFRERPWAETKFGEPG